MVAVPGRWSSLSSLMDRTTLREDIQRRGLYYGQPGIGKSMMTLGVVTRTLDTLTFSARNSRLHCTWVVSQISYLLFMHVSTLATLLSLLSAGQDQ